ncbi:MAG: hypothetical protein J0I12_05815 [Candidatus Eremiobacteraeota bacterium]|nr:hypothetical protein [Candidatus Eremiobacteraeota bacterium]
MKRLDVATVADFRSRGQSGPFASSSELFEARTLLFLGSWLENAGAARDWPLHLCCIGEPPETVVKLAHRCGAKIYRCLPWENEEMGPTFNKFRAFDIQAETPRLLMLDVDTIILQDLSPYAELPDGLCLLPNLINYICLESWTRVYQDLGLSVPSERWQSALCYYGGKHYPGEPHPGYSEPMPPYFNAGVIVAPWDSQLAQAWPSFAKELQKRYHGRSGDFRFLLFDEGSLALAVTELRGRGIPFTPLPPALHGHVLFYLSGAVTHSQVALFHATGLFRKRGSTASFDAIDELQLWAESQGERRASFPNCGPQQLREFQKLVRQLEGLMQRHVYPVMNSYDWKKTVLRTLRRHLLRPLLRLLRRLRQR